MKRGFIVCPYTIIIYILLLLPYVYYTGIYPFLFTLATIMYLQNEQISTEYRLKMLKYHPDKASDISLNGMTVDIGVTTHARASIF